MNEIRRLMETIESIEGSNSCVGCKFLYAQDIGYSNYTVTDTEIACALKKNPNLPKERPWDWGNNNYSGPIIPASPSKDNWPATNDSRCESYSVDETGSVVHLDVEGEANPADFTKDREAISAIIRHSKKHYRGK